MIAILALAAMISAFLIASALSRSSADVSNDREQRNMDSLRQAKAALIAYAANEQWQCYRGAAVGNPCPPPSTNTGYFQPGALPSPDMDGDGDGDFVWGSNTSSQLGRFPYKTVGTDDLRDASGERLWYALSHDFRKIRCNPPPPAAQNPLGCTRINSDTQGQLTVVGATPATQVVAIVFAPGDALAGQSRPSNTASDYLEGPPDLSSSVNYVFTSQATPSATFNDRLLVITQAELMAAVEPVVAAQIVRDVKPNVQNYYSKWGVYPFAMTFATPPASGTAYKGSPSPPAAAPGQDKGLLPVTDDSTWFKWWKATVTQIPPGYTGNEYFTSPPTCSINTSPPQAVCHIDYDDGAPTNDDFQARPDIMIRVYLQNANTSFADLPSPLTAPGNFTISRNGGCCVSDQGPPWGQFSSVGPPPGTPGTQPPPTTTFRTQTAVVAETGVIEYTARLQNAHDMNHGVTITIPLPTPSYLPIVSADPTVNPGAWFIANQWYRDTYYAVSPGYVSGGVAYPNPATCSPLPATPSCLTVKAAGTDKQAIIVLAGRQLNGTGRTNNPGDYFENANLTAVTGTAPFIYEHRAGVPTTINDRVVVVSP